MSQTTFSRETLYELVWSKSLAAISREYNISYQCLREVCQEMVIPLPPNGYWSKLQFGKTVEKDELWNAPKALQEISLWLRTDEEGVEYLSKKTSEKNKIKIETATKIKLPKKGAQVPAQYSNLVAITKEYYSQKRNSWKDWDYTNRRKSFEISVSQPLLKRAFHFLELFLQAIDQCGHKILLKGHNTYIVVFGEEMEICIVEKNNRIKIENSKWGETKLVPNGKLCLRYRKPYTTRDWSDTSYTLIEDKIVDIIASFEHIANTDIADRIELHKHWAEQDAIREKQKAIQARKEKELEDFKAMFQFSKRYQEANDLRNYINTFEQHAKDTNTLTEEKQDWIQWARQKADWYDPFINSEDELLAEVDKETLSFKKKSSW